MEGLTFTIIHRIEAPALTAALNNLAGALIPKDTSETCIPVSARLAEAPVVSPQPAPSVIPSYASVSAPTSAVIPPPISPPSPAKSYTLEDISEAGSQLLEQGKMPQLMELLKGFGVQAVTQLKPEQYPDLAAGLRDLGADI